MSTYTRPDSKQAPHDSPGLDATTRTEGLDDTGPVDPYETHNSAATFRSEATRRLPNTVDDANECADPVSNP